MKQFIEQRLEKEHKKPTLRADYVEFLELALLFLGGRPQKKSFQVTFHPPGAMHHARWMSKALYSLKIYLFRKQFHLPENQMQGLGVLNVFLIRYYIKLWFQSSDPCVAARIDLQFLQDMIRYIKVDENMAKLILQKFSRHLWYLSEEAIGMAIFDETISNEIKTKMVAKLRLGDPSSSEAEASTSSGSPDKMEELCEEQGEEDESEPQLEFNYKEEDDEIFSDVDDSDESNYEEESDISIRQPDEFDECHHKVLVDVEEMIKTYLKKDVSDFVTRKTYQFFQRFQIPCSFLQKPPAKWKSDPEYQEAREIVMKLKVVNDTAERGIQLMSIYNSLLTKNEREKQFILQVVSFYTKKYPSWHIKDLVQS